MKKILPFIAFILFGMSWQLNSQVYIQEDFDSGFPSGWDAGTYLASTIQACSGTSIRDNVYNFSSVTNTASFSQVATGEDILVSFDYKIVDYDFSAPTDATTGDFGDIYLQYSVDGGASWTNYDTINEDNHLVTSNCFTWANIIQGTDVPNGSDFAWKLDGTWTSGDYFIYIDDFSAIEQVNCLQVSDLSVNNLTDVSADIDWTENGSATEWNIEWGSPGFTPGVGDEIDSELANTSQTSNITGLTGNTVYDVYVQADCGADQSVWVGPISFITDPSPQTPISSFPWDEDFETGGADWTLINGFETNQWQVGTATNNGGSNGLYISEDGGTSHTYDNGSTSIVHAYRDITLPAAGVEVNMSFDWLADAENCCDYLRVFLVPTSFTPSAGSTITTSGSAPTGNIQIGGNFNDQLSYTNFETTIPNDYLGETFRVVFQWRNDGDSGDNPPAGIDNINISVFNCASPSDIVLDNVGINDADLSWTPGDTETDWNVQWGAPGFTPTVDQLDDAVVNPNPNFNVTGLTANTAYEFYVQADCGGDLSSWVGPFSFNTLQTPVTSFPWDEDFETGGTDWTLINGSETNQWHVGTATNNGGSNGLYISEDGGTSHTYNSGSTSIVHAYRDITLPAAGEEVNMSFDWIADAENCCDYLRVFIVPTSFTPSAGSMITASGSAPTGNIQIGGDFNDQLSYTNFATTIPNDYLGETFRVVFQWRNDFSSGDNPPAGIDNVNIDVVTCAMPSDIAFSDIGSDSLVVSWTSNGSETDWVIEYGETGFTLGSGTQVATTDNPDTITGLDSFTEYDFYVWSDCGGGDLSDTLGPETVTTLCTASSGTEEYTGCEGDGYSVEVNGTTYDEATPTGTETIIGGSFTGCDSIVSINLTYAPPATGVDVVTACESFTWIDGNEYTENNNSATHVLAGASANGCDSIVTLDLTITPSLDLTVEEVVNSSNDLVLIAQETNASYQWLDCNDGLSPIAGANNQTLMPIANGSYAVRVSKGACTDTTNCVDVLTLSTEEITLENKLNIYPNPSNGIFNVEGYGDHATNIIVLDALGRKVLDKVISESTTVVDLTNMKQGVYLFNIVENGEQTLRKVILK